jgi:hypothetical protein
MSRRQLHAVDALTAGKTGWTWWRSDKFLLLPGIEPLITSQYDFKDIPASAETGENDGKMNNQSRDTYSS